MSNPKVPRVQFKFYQVYDRGVDDHHDKEIMRSKRPKGLMTKVLDRCRSLGSYRKCSDQKHQQHKLPPEGYFTVYVGPARERFVVRMESVNHPLFRQLLDEAEVEHGYSTPGPLELPCDVEVFRQVLSEMESDDDQMAPRCSLMITRAHSSYHLLSPARQMVMG